MSGGFNLDILKSFALQQIGDFFCSFSFLFLT